MSRFNYKSVEVELPPRVTIITPFHGAGVAFHETARSVLRQSFQEWEWMIVNDGSSCTEALSIVQGYRQRDRRIRMLDHGATGGLSEGGQGFLEARTRYVVRLDCDQLLEPTAVEKWYWFLESHPETDFVTDGSDGITTRDVGLLSPRGEIPEPGAAGMMRIPGYEPLRQAKNFLLDALPCDNRLHKDKQRLMLIVPWFNMGGTEKFNLDLVDHLARQGWEVTVAATLPGPHGWLPYFARYTPDTFILHHFLRLEDYPRFLRYLIQSRRIDVVMISHSELGYLLLPYLRAHFPEVTFIDFCHIEELWKGGGFPRMSVEYQKFLDLNIVASDHLKRWMVGHGADPSRIRVRYVNVDPEIWRPDPERRALARRELGLQEAIPVIFYAGRICLQKRPRVFAATMLRLRQKGLRISALVAGDGPDFAWLRKFIDRNGMHEEVQLLGAVSIERMQQLMTAADIFFLPSQWEGIALSIYEAMAAGLPIVAAGVGGQRELVTPDCGILIPRSNEQTEISLYAEALVELLQDPERRVAMGERGRARVSNHFHLGQLGENMIGLLNEAGALRERRRSPTVSLDEGRACGAKALKYVRLFQSAEELRNERGSYRRILALANGMHWRAGIYAVLRWFYGPFYRCGVKRGGAWYFPVAERIKQALLGSP